LDQIKNNPKVLTVHGDGVSCIRFAEEIRERYGYDAKAPDIGETVTI
jgi:putative mRNA 3-end processing factor